MARDGINPNEICTRVSQVYSSIFNVLFLSVRQILLSSLVRCLLVPFSFESASSSFADLLPHFWCCSLNLSLFILIVLLFFVDLL